MQKLLVLVIEDVFLQNRADGGLFDAEQQMASSVKTNQPCARNRGSRELGVVVKLQAVVSGVENQSRRSDRSNPLIRHCRLIVERSASGARRNRVHVLDQLIYQFPLLRAETGNDRVIRAHQLYQLPLEQLGDAPVKRILFEDCRKSFAFLIRLSLVFRG